MAKKFTDEEVFAIFGVGKGDGALRKFIHGQRKINGSLYREIEQILKHLNKQSGSSKKASPELEKANNLNEQIPGKVPPFCS